MGLNLETLIGILVILILLILADGMRRMFKERQGRLRMRIDPRYKDAQDDDDDNDYNPELIGSARVIRRSVEADRQAAAQQQTPPMVMEADEGVSESRAAEQQALFDAPEQDAQPEAYQAEPEPAMAREQVREPQPEEKPAVAAKSEPEPAPRAQPRSREPQPVLEVIVVHLIARRGAPFDGQHLLRLLLESGLRYGEMNIFHRHVQVQGEDELQFSMANAVEPGTFDLDTMEEQTFAGVTFFLKLPGPTEAMGALDRMLTICCRLASELDGELRDEQRSVLTQQTMEHLRQRVQDFERLQRVPSA